MREERKFKASHFENIQELIASCIIWIKTDDYDAYCRFFDMGAMEELIKELNNIKEIEKSHQEENGKLRVEFEKVYEDNLTLAKELEKYKTYYEEMEEVNKKFISVDKIKEIQVQLCMQLGSYVRNEASPGQERIAGGINIINKILEEK